MIILMTLRTLTVYFKKAYIIIRITNISIILMTIIVALTINTFS